MLSAVARGDDFHFIIDLLLISLHSDLRPHSASILHAPGRLIAITTQFEFRRVLSVIAMPPKSSRSRRGAAATNAQSTLSFKNRVTKKSAPATHTDVKGKPSTRLSDAAKEEIVETVTPTDPEPVSVEVEPEQATTEPQTEPEVVVVAPTPRKKKRISTASSAGIDPREAQAEKITDAQISKWWKQEEKERKAPRGTSHYLRQLDPETLRLDERSSCSNPPLFHHPSRSKPQQLTFAPSP